MCVQRGRASLKNLDDGNINSLSAPVIFSFRFRYRGALFSNTVAYFRDWWAVSLRALRVRLNCCRGGRRAREEGKELSCITSTADFPICVRDMPTSEGPRRERAGRVREGSPRALYSLNIMYLGNLQRFSAVRVLRYKNSVLEWGSINSDLFSILDHN